MLQRILWRECWGVMLFRYYDCCHSDLYFGCFPVLSALSQLQFCLFLLGCFSAAARFWFFFWIFSLLLSPSNVSPNAYNVSPNVSLPQPHDFSSAVA